jgi:small subunit ribosomal protein S21
VLSCKSWRYAAFRVRGSNAHVARRKCEKDKFMKVLVRENNVEQAMRVLKKKLQREGVFREMKERRAYEKPSESRVREHAQAISRHRKAAKKKLQREGLLPAARKRPSAR